MVDYEEEHGDSSVSKPWVYPLEDSIPHVDSLDWIIWNLAQRVVREYVFINTHMEVNEIMDMMTMNLIQEGQ